MHEDERAQRERRRGLTESRPPWPQLPTTMDVMRKERERGLRSRSFPTYLIRTTPRSYRQTHVRGQVHLQTHVRGQVLWRPPDFEGSCSGGRVAGSMEVRGGGLLEPP